MSSTELSAFSRQALSIRDEAVFWKPLIFAKDQMNRGQHWLNPVARLRAGLSIEQARGKLTALRATLNDVIYQKDWGFTVDPFAKLLVGINGA